MGASVWEGFKLEKKININEGKIDLLKQNITQKRYREVVVKSALVEY